ncbi:hypothetical protein, partial [Ideonella azotifigens]
FIRQTNGKVTQMGHSWIKLRLPKALARAPGDLVILCRRKEGAYPNYLASCNLAHDFPFPLRLNFRSESMWYRYRNKIGEVSSYSNLLLE